MANKSVTVAGKEEKPVSKQQPSAIQKVLRQGATLGVAAGIVLGASEAEAQMQTNTLNFSSIHPSVSWTPEGSTLFNNGNSGPVLNAFTAGTLDSVVLDFTVNYTASDTVGSTGPVYHGVDTFSLNPTLTLSSGSISSDAGLLSGTPSLNFSFSVGGTTNTIAPVSGSLTYELTLSTPTELSSFYSENAVVFSLANASTEGADAPSQAIAQSGGAGTYASDVNVNESITMQVTEVSTAPEPSTVALAGLGAAALFALRRRR